LSLEAQVRELALLGYGRSRIMRAIPDATEHLIKRVIKEVRPQPEPSASAKDLSEFKPEAFRHFDAVSALRPITFTAQPAVEARQLNPEHCVTRLYFGDSHAPYHDPLAIGAVCKLIELQSDIRLDSVTNLGDGCDFYVVSRFDKDPTRRNQLQDELLVAAEVNYQLTEAARAVPAKHYVEGNHEARLALYILKQAPALAALPQLKVENLLGLGELGWEYHTDGFYLEKEDFLVKHGEFIASSAGATASKEIAAAWTSGITGHVHRLAMVGRSTWLHSLKGLAPTYWIEAGSTCMPDMDYMKGRHTNWQQGAVIVQFSEYGIHPTLIPIHQGRFVFNGKQYAAQ
jgi:hypothetical protein